MHFEATKSHHAEQVREVLRCALVLHSEEKKGYNHDNNNVPSVLDSIQTSTRWELVTSDGQVKDSEVAAVPVPVSAEAPPALVLLTFLELASAGILAEEAENLSLVESPPFPSELLLGLHLVCEACFKTGVIFGITCLNLVPLSAMTKRRHDGTRCVAVSSPLRPLFCCSLTTPLP